MSALWWEWVLTGLTLSRLSPQAAVGEVEVEVVGPPWPRTPSYRALLEVYR
jgi:hypothetical protein